ncbi:ComEC/Rec2 family competence protein [Gimibacter soli]|uniref:ComEC/Rec2 family competence protein n=1 Tax=Gimibacter soli TaxID=3024400 RepID=A0AAE9XQA6_9PROT|nr:ComEC/Rec2 family competence protein [Gimibacter soli]WCL52960.1 ComEC/Rec2 family competence protein [Gimibacter soli]
MDGSRVSGKRDGWQAHLLQPVIFARDGRVAALAFALLFGAGFGANGGIPVLASAMLCLAAFAIFRYAPARLQLGLLAVAAFALGHAWATARVPKLADISFWPAETYIAFTGEVDAVEQRGDRGLRLTVTPQEFTVQRREGPPGRLRLMVRTDAPVDLVPGDIVTLEAIVGPPKGPVYPGGYDFRRHAVSQAVTGEGFAVSAIVRVAEAEGGGMARQVERWRSRIAQDLQTLMPGQAGALAAALLVGIRGGLDQATLDAMRDAGLAHMLAISGLHMGIIAGGAFLLFEMLAAAIPGLAHRILPRRVAALMGMFVATAYLVLSGMGIPTIRAYIMVMIGFTAVLANRRALSLRSLAIAALVIVAVDPAAVSSAGFQMSFAATAGLVAAYEVWTRYRTARRARGDWAGDERGITGRIAGFIAASLATTLVAEASIAAVGLYHFQHLTLLGAVANLVGVPVLAWFIMPLAILTLLLMIVGLPAVTAPLLGWGLESLIELAVAAAGMPGAVLYRWMPGEAYLCLTLPFALFVVARDKRLWAASALLVIAGLALTGQARRPDLLIDSGGRLIARFDQTRQAMQSTSGRQSFRTAAWARQWGLRPGLAQEKLPGACDAAGCLWDIGLEKPLAVPRDLSAVEEDCPQAAIAVVEYRWRRYCKGADIMITTRDLEESGPVAVWYGSSGSSPRLEWSREQEDRHTGDGP